MPDTTFPTLIAAAEKGSNTNFEIAEALLRETVKSSRGPKSIEKAQEALAEEGHKYALSRLRNMRRVAVWVQENSTGSGRIDWQDVSWTVHEEACDFAHSGGIDVHFDWDVFVALIKEKRETLRITDEEGMPLPFEVSKSGRTTGRLVADDLRIYCGKTPTRPRTELEQIAENEEDLEGQVRNTPREARIKVSQISNKVTKEEEDDEDNEILAPPDIKAEHADVTGPARRAISDLDSLHDALQARWEGPGLTHRAVIDPILDEVEKKAEAVRKMREMFQEVRS